MLWQRKLYTNSIRLNDDTIFFFIQLKGFPTKILTRSQLIDVLKRIVFIPVQHHSVNYPVVYYAGFVPNQPSKLYDDPRVPPRQFGFDTLPQAHVAAVSLKSGILVRSWNANWNETFFSKQIQID